MILERYKGHMIEAHDCNNDKIWTGVLVDVDDMGALLQPNHNISYVFSGYAIQSYATKFYFVFAVFKVRTDKGYEYRLKVIDNDHTFSELPTRLVTKEELSLDKALAELVNLNELLERKKSKKKS